MTTNLGLWKLILPGAEKLSHDGMAIDERLLKVDESKTLYKEMLH